LGDALASLAEQTYHDFEVIVVDDGSSDDSIAVASLAIASWGLRGTVLRRPESRPKGVSGCRNEGVANAHGDWVAFLDSDDRFATRKLERVAAALCSASTSVVGVHHPVRQVDDSTGASLGLAGERRATAGEAFRTALLRGNFVVTSAAVVRRATLAALGGFDAKLNGVEDYWQWLRVARRGEWLSLDEPLTDYRVRPGSLMQHREFAHYAQQFTMLMDVAKRSGELDRDELGLLERNVIGEATRHFAGEAFERSGWTSLLGGATVLCRAGFVSDAASILASHAKRSLLTLATRVYHAS